MAFSTISFTVESGVARLTLDRPDRLNSFTVQMHQEVAEALGQLGEARVLVLTGAGRGFCAGQDLNDRAIKPGGSSDLASSIRDWYNPLVRRLRDLPIPVIARVNGVAAGAGANLALACDIVIAAKSAKFIQSFANIGLIPDSGGTWVLPRLIGQARAMAISLTATPVGAEQAEAWGMIWKAVDDDALDAEVDALAARFAAAPTKGLAAIRSALRAGWDATLDEQLDLEEKIQGELGRSYDYKEGVAAFIEKRQPRFTGR